MLACRLVATLSVPLIVVATTFSLVIFMRWCSGHLNFCAPEKRLSLSQRAPACCERWMVYDRSIERETTRCPRRCSARVE